MSIQIQTKEREFLIECLRLYKELQCLWNVKSKEYYDRVKKNDAYITLLSKYRQVFPNATKRDLIKKINSLRTNYRKELKKYSQAVKSGDTYKSTLWYYKEMKFLEDLENSSELNSDGQQSSQQAGLNCNVGYEDDYSETSEDSSTFDIPHLNDKKEKRRLENEELTSNKRVRVQENEFVNWAIVCASDLQKMDPIQQIYAKKAIADILMEGQLGLLHRDSAQINCHHHYNNNLSNHEYYHNKCMSSSAKSSYIDNENPLCLQVKNSQVISSLPT